MQMLPGQLVVEGSTSLVARSMVPLIPAGSSYYTMKALSIKEKAATLGERVMHKHLFVDGEQEGMTVACLCTLWVTNVT